MHYSSNSFGFSSVERTFDIVCADFRIRCTGDSLAIRTASWIETRNDLEKRDRYDSLPPDTRAKA
jgi:hypothetical protein